MSDSPPVRARDARRLLPVLALVGGVGIAGIAVGRVGQPPAVAPHRQSIDRLGRIGGSVLDFEKRVLAHRVVDFLGEVERGQLEQSNSVLQAGRDRVLLPLAGLERG